MTKAQGDAIDEKVGVIAVLFVGTYTTRKICFDLLVTQSVFVNELTFAGKGKLKEALSDVIKKKNKSFCYLHCVFGYCITP